MRSIVDITRAVTNVAQVVAEGKGVWVANVACMKYGHNRASSPFLPHKRFGRETVEKLTGIGARSVMGSTHGKS
jgi:predicted metal-binding protein